MKVSFYLQILLRFSLSIFFFYLGYASSWFSLYFSWLDCSANINCNYLIASIIFSSIVTSHIASVQFPRFLLHVFLSFPHLFIFYAAIQKIFSDTLYKFFLEHSLLFKSFTEFLILSIAVFRRSIECFLFEICHITSYSLVCLGKISS